MENTVFSGMEEIDDISTKDEFGVAKRAGLSDEEAFAAVSKYSRDNARTPMQWDDSENAGFGKGRPWLKVNPNYKQINVESQLHDKDSVLNFYKKTIALRKSEEFKEVLSFGKMERIKAPKRVMAFSRENDTQKLIIYANFQNKEEKISLPSSSFEILLNNEPRLKVDGNSLTLSGYQAIVLSVDL